MLPGKTRKADPNRGESNWVKNGSQRTPPAMVQLRRTSASLQLLQSVLLKHYYLNDWHNFNDMIKFLINVLLHYYFQFWKWRSAKDVFQECAVYCPIIKELCVPSSAVFEVLHLCVCLAWAWRRTALQQMQGNWGTTWTQVVKWAFQDNQCVFTIHSAAHESGNRHGFYKDYDTWSWGICLFRSDGHKKFVLVLIG